MESLSLVGQGVERFCAAQDAHKSEVVQEQLPSIHNVASVPLAPCLTASHGVQTHALFPAVDLKSTPLATQADSRAQVQTAGMIGTESSPRREDLHNKQAQKGRLAPNKQASPEGQIASKPRMADWHNKQARKGSHAFLSDWDSCRKARGSENVDPELKQAAYKTLLPVIALFGQLVIHTSLSDCPVGANE